MDGMRYHLIENTSLYMMGRHEIWEMRLRIKMLEGQVRVLSRRVRGGAGLGGIRRIWRGSRKKNIKKRSEPRKGRGRMKKITSMTEK